MFIGRANELELFNESYLSNKNSLIVVYGRRRIGKTSLLQSHIYKKQNFYFEAIEGQNTKFQIKHFLQQLSNQLNDPIIKQTKLTNWSEVFHFISRFLDQKKKTVIIFDELQWMAAGQTKLISLIKFFWDHEWSKYKVNLILCGSIASFMINRVINSKALYGRMSFELHLLGVQPHEAMELLDYKRGTLEVLKYLMILGNVPKYLLEINHNKSFETNINNLCFKKSGFLVNELEKIFYSQFKEAKTYLDIIKVLSKQPQTMLQVSKKLKKINSGGFQSYLKHLEQADFIKGITPYDKKQNSKNKKYKLIDEFLIFYFKFIYPNKTMIQESQSNIFKNLVQSKWQSWLGIAFENFCLKNALFIAKKWGFEEQVSQYGPYFNKNSEGFQVDLIYLRNDSIITICEIKFSHLPIDTKIIPEMEKKCKLIKPPRGFTIEKALISLFGPTNSLRDSSYFHHYLTIEDIFRK